MWALSLVAGLIGAGVLARLVFGRDHTPPIERHLRALEALRDLSEQPRQLPDLVAAPEMTTDHVHILSEAPAGAGRPRRSASRRTATGRPRRDTRRPARARAGDDERTTIEIRPAARTRPAGSAGTGRVASGKPRHAEPGGSPAPVPALAFGDLETPDLETPDLETPDLDETTPATAPPGPRRSVPRRARERLASVSPRVYATIAAAAAVVIAIGLVAAIVVVERGPSRAGAAKPPPVRPAHVQATTTTRTPTSTSPATAVAAATVVARSTNGATISVRSPFQLTLRASGTCWVQVSDPSGRVLLTGTLHAGQQQQLPVGGPIVVRLGYTPAITISVDGVTLDLSGLGQTANLDFQNM